MFALFKATKRRRYALVAMAFAAALTVTGCSGSDESAPEVTTAAPASEVTVSLNAEQAPQYCSSDKTFVGLDDEEEPECWTKADIEADRKTAIKQQQAYEQKAIKAVNDFAKKDLTTSDHADGFELQTNVSYRAYAVVYFCSTQTREVAVQAQTAYDSMAIPDGSLLPGETRAGSFLTAVEDLCGTTPEMMDQLFPVAPLKSTK